MNIFSDVISIGASGTSGFYAGKNESFRCSDDGSLKRDKRWIPAGIGVLGAFLAPKALSGLFEGLAAGTIGGIAATEGVRRGAESRSAGKTQGQLSVSPAASTPFVASPASSVSVGQ